MNEDYNCPCRDIDPDNFITNEEVIEFLKTKDNYKFKQEDYFRLYNCVHCGACGTHYERFLLKQKFLEDGNKIEGLSEQIEILEKFGTPFKYNKSRIRPLKGIKKNSKTILYFGCFTTVKTPKYAENTARYLLSKDVDFCILDQEICCGYPILCAGEHKIYNKFVEKNLKLFKEKGFKQIITVCPSCYMVFKKHYREHNIKVKYFTEYLKPPKTKKSGNLIVQHACPLKNGEIPNIADDMEDLFRKSGYNVLSEVPRECCGFGVGHQLRVDISEAIVKNRMQDFREERGYLRDLQEGDNYITSYCPNAFWALKAYGRKEKVKFKARDMCDLLLY